MRKYTFNPSQIYTTYIGSTFSLCFCFSFFKVGQIYRGCNALNLFLFSFDTSKQNSLFEEQVLRMTATVVTSTNPTTHKITQSRFEILLNIIKNITLASD